MKKNVIHGVMVIAGHLDPCGNIGTEGRFDLVAIPWDAGEFADKVAKMIKFDLGQKMLAEHHARTPPLDPGDLDALVRGVGLRIWIQLENPDQSIMNLLTEGYSVSEMNAAAKAIDCLSFNVESLDYRWPDTDPQNQRALVDLEALIFNRFENVGQAKSKFLLRHRPAASSHG